jgi:hypothetical protein
MRGWLAALQGFVLMIALAWLPSMRQSAAETAATIGTHEPIRVPFERQVCTPEQRRAVLRDLQTQVVQVAPREIESLIEAIGPHGPLAGWRLSHGHVVIAGGGSMPVDNLEATPPMPPLLLYAPSAESSPEDWLDFDGPDGPYRLVGWAYVAPYEEGSSPPARECLGESEWFIHEAGWHLTDGGMHLTPDATTEPADPPPGIETLFWHPRVWDIHFWIGEDGVPVVAFDNPQAPAGGVRLPEGSFYRLVKGRKEPLTVPGG